MTSKAEFDIVTALRSMEFFHNMDPKHLRKLAVIASEVTFEKGDLVYKEGDLDKGMYLVQEGEVRLNGEVEHRKRAKLRPGDIVEVFDWRICMK